VWPSVEERKQIACEMKDTFPNCMGYIDGSHINLEEAPTSDPESYFDRKQNSSVQLQAVCDHAKRIRHIFVGYPGSTHDARVFNNSQIGRNPEKFFSKGQWIAGDSAYPISSFLLTPFRRNASFSTENKRKLFNKYFASNRVKIECCFGILKETFGSLKELRVRVNDKHGHLLACKWITACCVLYNMCCNSLLNEEIITSRQDDDNYHELGNERYHDGGDELRRELFEFIMKNCDS
jgi:hypothetical protein